jgi:cysteinyl-tRNA synthetase
MRWSSPWSDGFPGWHVECTAMSTKYLGSEFDIHGGGMDLLFPHHEAEIAQSVICNGHESARYWMHNNLITINGQKMGKSLGNFINLDDFFGGNHSLLEKAYSPMTIRFFMLQAHYRSTLDFSNSAIQAAEKGLERLMNAIAVLDTIVPSNSAGSKSALDVTSLKEKCYKAIGDDLNSPILIAHLFDGVKAINSLNDGSLTISAENLEELKQLYHDFVFDILGLMPTQNSESGSDEVLDDVVNLLLNLRLEAKNNKDWDTADKIRNQLNTIGITIKDTKEGADWEFKR